MADTSAGETDRSPKGESALEFLRDCARRRATVVPLVGAGLSVGAGIPPLAHVSEHLVRISRALSQRKRNRSYLAEHGWPSRHDINVELHARLHEAGESFADDLSQAREQLFEEAIAENARRRSSLLADVELRAKLIRNQLPVPSDGLWSTDLERTLGKSGGREWLLFLQHLSRSGDDCHPEDDYHPELVDLYFSRLTRGRSPSSAHHFMAFLTKVFGWRLILTTNFDDLLETALRSQGLNPVVFELAQDPLDPERQIMPGPRLVQSTDQVAILKLHGGTHGLHAGYHLDQPMPSYQVKRCLQYLELENARALLVLGYGAEERRVTSLISAWQSSADKISNKKVVWIYRSDGPAQSEGTLMAQAEDPGLFLHELHQRILFTHPAGLHPYTALHSAPRRDYAKLYITTESSPPENASRRALRGWYLAKKDARTQRDTRTSTRLWFSMQDYPNCASFVSSLVETLEVADRGLPVAARPWNCSFASEHRGAPANDRNTEAIEQRYRELVAAALTRYPYRIAIDTQRAFVGGLPTVEEQRSLAGRNLPEETRLFRFLGAIVKLGIGESRLGIALHPEATPELHGLAAGTAVEFLGERTGAEPNAERLAQEIVARCFDIAKSNVARGGDDVVGPYLLKVCVAFRRPRSLAGLAKVTAALLEREEQRMFSGGDADDPFVGAYSVRYEAIVKKIGHFLEHGLLEQLDGGFYSMCSYARLSLLAEYQKHSEWAKQFTYIEGRIADYYFTELYEHSRDPHAFFEYTYHRAAVAAIAAQQANASADRQQRVHHFERYVEQFEWLTASIERDGDEIAARGSTSRLLLLVERIERRVNDAKGALQKEPEPTMDAEAGRLADLASRHERLEERLLAIKATIFRRTADFSHSLKCHSKLLMSPQSRSLGLEPVDAAGRIRAAEQLLGSEEMDGPVEQGFQQVVTSANRCAIADRAEDFARAVFQEEKAEQSPQFFDAEQITARCKAIRLEHADPSRLLQRASRLLELAICISSSSQSAYARAFPEGPLGLVGDAETYAGAALAAAKKSNGGELHGFATMILVRCKKTRLKHHVRNVEPPWDWSRQQQEWPFLGKPEHHRAVYDDAGRLLRDMRPGPRTKALQCSIRCAYARTLYLSGDFSHGSAELNRAHPLAAHAGGFEGLTALVEYHLHRAEYCLFRATREPAQRGDHGAAEGGESRGQNSWLFGAAMTALNEAEANLRRSDRSVVSWRWLFQLRAWCAREQLSLVRRNEQDPHRTEGLLLTGLRAVAGTLLNADALSRTELAAIHLWIDLCNLHDQLRNDDVASWAELNFRAGLTSLSARKAASNLTLLLTPHSSGAQLQANVRDLALSGIGLAPEAVESFAVGTLFDAELQGNPAQPVKLTVRKKRSNGLAVVGMPRNSITPYLKLLHKSGARLERLRENRRAAELAQT